MAPPAGTLRVGRYFLALLAIIAVLYTIVFWPGSRHTPKLGLDLSGGTQVIFTAKAPGGKAPSRGQMNEAKTIMEQRVNGSGVTEATVVIQGSDQIVISIPGSTNADITRLGKAAALSLRGAVMPATPVTCRNPNQPAPSPSSSPTTSPTGSAAPTASGSASPNAAAVRPLTGPHAAATPTPTATPSAKTTGSATATAKPTGSAKATASPTPAGTSTGTPTAAVLPPCETQPFAGLKFDIPTSEAAYDKLTADQHTQLQTALAKVDCNTNTVTDQADNAPYYFACDDGKTYGAKIAYLFGNVIVPGTEISNAAASAPSPSQGKLEWTVTLSMKTTGQKNWDKYTSAHNQGGASGGSSIVQCGATGTPCADFVGFVLDGSVISAPVNREPIHGGKTEISGNFTQKSSKELANQLRYGALPLSFTASTSQTVSPTLGTSQLKAGLLAGGIGLILVVIYSLLYYRALGLVTIASLVVSGILTYGCLVMLGTQIGFTLSLAGIAGFIVAVGITADSFVVFFERIKDEVHEGRSMRVAIPRAWVRARRTILSADTVSFLAAAILYYFAAGDVKGFAFTLGLSTVLDLVVVFLFTHPIVSLLSRSKTFGSARFTGLSALAAPPVATGRPAAARPAARPARPARPAGAEEAADRDEAGGSSLAILDWDEADLAEDDGAAAETVQSTEVVESSAPAEPESESATDEEAAEPVQAEPDAGDEERVRRRTTPEAGSAAERAAARRARLRAQADEKGDK